MTGNKKGLYPAKDGKMYPIEEAIVPLNFDIYKTDHVKAKKEQKMGDPTSCMIARAAQRVPNVVEAFIGTGRDAYVLLEARNGKPRHALHYFIGSRAGKLRDAFDQDILLRHQTVKLLPAPPSRTLASNRARNKKRKAEVKAGAKVRTTPIKRRQTRLIRIGIPNRPNLQDLARERAVVPEA